MEILNYNGCMKSPYPQNWKPEIKKAFIEQWPRSEVTAAVGLPEVHEVRPWTPVGKKKTEELP
jgi:hypothetical protein